MKFKDLTTWRILEESCISQILQQPCILIKGDLLDERDNLICEKTGNNKVITLKYETESTELEVLTQGLTVSITSSRDPVEEILQLACCLSTMGETIILDITGLATEVIFLLLKSFKQIAYDNVVAAYVQPKEYRNQRDEILVPDYVLSETRSTISPIPGFMVLPRDLPTLLITFLGFEGGRFQELCEHVLTERDTDIRPVLPLPSYIAGWHMQSLYSNLLTLKELNKIRELKRITAWDPFYALNYLEELYDTYSGHNQITVAPLGTKPHILATAIFAIRHEDIVVLYDSPKVSLHRSDGIGTVRGYLLKGLFI